MALAVGFLPADAGLIARAAMESEQIFCVAKSEKLWESRVWEAWGISPVGQEIVCSIGLYVFWSFVFYGLYRCKLFFQVRQREARQSKLLKAHRIQSDSERAAIEHHWPWPEVQSRGDSVLDLSDVPRRRRSRNANQPLVNPETNATQVLNGGSDVDFEAIPRLIPVMMCTPECTLQSCKRKLKESTSDLRAPRQDITRLEASGWVFQTQLKLSSATANILRGLAAKQFCGAITMQLGRWRACCLIDGEAKTLKLDDTDMVPVILHSSYAAGVLTVEGLNLKNATIQIASTRRGNGYSYIIDKSKKGGNILETKCNEGAGGLEVHTCICELPKKHSVAEVSVLAFTKIDKDGFELRVSSLPVQIQDDSLRTVLRDILPFSIFVTYTAMKIPLSVIYASPVVASLILFMIIASTQILPQSTEAKIKLLLKKITIQVSFSFYYAFQTFMYELKTYVSGMKSAKDADFPRRKDKISNCPRSKIQISLHHNKKGPSDVQDEDFLASHGSASVLSPDWQWPIFDTIYNVKGSHLDRRKEGEDVELAETTKVPFVVVYLNLENLPWANQVQVNISSPFLTELLLGKLDRWRCKKIVKMGGSELFRNYENVLERQVICEEKLKSLETSSSTDVSFHNQEELRHITHLVRFMDKEFKEIKEMYAGMEKERCVTWDMLWAFLPPGERVVFRDEVTDDWVCGEVLLAYYKVGKKDDPKLVVEITRWDYNCQDWSEYSSEVNTPKFAGENAFSRLKIRPIRFEEDSENSENTFLEHGRRFCELAMMESTRYMDYKGSMYHADKRFFDVAKENADGRVMIDLRSFSKMNPDFSLKSAKPPNDIIRDNTVINIDITKDPTRMFAPSFVYGFSFHLKKWGCFSVSGFSDIKFNDSAYDDLVMNEATKALTYSLVKEHLKEGKKKLVPHDNDCVGSITNKGEGCILLCYGLPGTGKTLTAESLAEKLRCPLWSLSVFELGITPEKLETMLVKVLDVVASWGAILLHDEADVYLERRSSKDLTRNAMTGVFLRQLEYYRGVMFLTTNRDFAFDEAICSRIALFLYYGRHDEQQRSTIWTNLFNQVDLKDFTNEDLAEFSKPNFNGREIRKIIKTAQTLAKSKDLNLKAQHVREALTVYEESSRLRISLNPSIDDNFLVHQHHTNAPLNLQEGRSKSAFASTLSEFHPSSYETNIVDKCPQLTPSSSDNSNQPRIVEECHDPSTIYK